MKQIKLALCVIIIILTCLFCSCGFFGEQRYSCDVEEVESLQIIRLDRYIDGEYRYEYTVLSEIEDISAVVERLVGTKHSVNWGDPYQFDIGYIVVKINYLNGDYDLIHHEAQWFNRDGVNQNGYFFFDKEQIESLIHDYL